MLNYQRVYHIIYHIIYKPSNIKYDIYINNYAKPTNIYIILYNILFTNHQI